MLRKCEECGRLYESRRKESICEYCKSEGTKAFRQRKRDVKKRSQALHNMAREAHEKHLTYGQLQAQMYLQKQHEEFMQAKREREEANGT